jgi:flagellar basal body-associated protein FliL
MQGKLKIIILTVIALASFGASYFVSPMIFGDGNAAKVSADDEQVKKDDTSVPGVIISPESAQTSTIEMQNKEVKALITELRLKLDNSKAKEKELAEREKRIKIAGLTLTKQAQDLEKLRLVLIPALQRYQETRAAWEKSLTQITATEEKNIKLLSARYDSMDATGSSKILADLWNGNQQELAIKILYYMQARSAAKVLAALSTSKEKEASELAAKFCEKFPTVRKPPAEKG